MQIYISKIHLNAKPPKIAVFAGWLSKSHAGGFSFTFFHKQTVTYMYIYRPIPHQQQHQSSKLDEESLRATIQIIVFLSQYE